MLNAAVVGVGNMGRHHARIYSELSDVELIAVCDSNEKIAKEIASKFNCKHYVDYKKMLSNEKIDIVSIAIPTIMHKEAALDFLNKKIHVLLEKPICKTVEEAECIIKSAKNNGVILSVGHIERYNPGVIRIKKMIDDGIFGDIISIDAKRVGVYPSQIKDSDVVVDVAIHDIDIINYLYGDFPEKVFSNKGVAIGTHRADYVDILLTYGKKSGSIQCNWITPVKIRTLAVTGTKAYAELNYMTQELKLFKTTITRKTDNFGDFIFLFGKPEIDTIQINVEEPLKNEISNFVNAVLKKEKLRITAEEATKALEIALKI